MITASQLVAEVSANGADTTASQLVEVGSASDRVISSFDGIIGSAQMVSGFLIDMDDSVMQVTAAFAEYNLGITGANDALTATQSTTLAAIAANDDQIAALDALGTQYMNTAAASVDMSTATDASVSSIGDVFTNVLSSIQDGISGFVSFVQESFAQAAESADSSLTSIRETAASSMTMVQESAIKSSGGFLGALGDMGGGLMGLLGQAGMTAMGIQMFGQMAVQVGGMLIGPDADMEQMKVAFENVLHSGTAAQQMLQDISNFAAKTPFQMMDLDQAAAKLLAFGETKNVVIPDLTAIGDTLSDLGRATPARLQMVIDAFGKIDTTGKLTGGVMMELSRLGINAWQALSDASGKSIPDLQAMVKHGLIPASEATTWLRDGLEKLYGSGMAHQALTFNGLLSTFKDNIEAAWRAFSGPLFDMAKAGLEQLGNLVASPAFQNFAQTAGQVLADALSRVGSLVSWVIRQFEVWANLLANNPTWQLFISEIIDGWNSIMDAFSGFGTWIASMWPDVMHVIQIAWSDTIGVLAEGLTWIVNEIHDFAGQWNAVWSAIQSNSTVQGLERGLISVFRSIQDAAAGVFTWFQTEIPKIPAWFAATWQAIQSNPIFQALEGLAVSVFTGIEHAALNAKTWIQQHWGDITTFVQGKLHDLQQMAEPLLAQIGRSAQDAFAHIQPTIAPALEWLTANWQQIPTMILQGWEQIANDPHVQIFMKTLAAAGDWIKAQFLPVWQQLIITFQTQLVPAWDHLQHALAPIMPSLQQIAEFVGTALVVYLGIWVGLIAGFISALAGFLTGAIQLIGGIIQIFAGLIEFFQGMWNFIVDLFSGNWGRLESDTQDMCNGISDIIMGLFNVVVGYFSMVFGTVLGFARGFITGIVGYFTFLYDEIVGHSIIPDLVNGIISWISQLPGRAIDQIIKMVNGVVGQFNNLLGQAVSKSIAIVNGITDNLGNLGSLALKWGQDLMNNLIAGINGGLKDVGNAAQHVAGTISSWLHFSKPDIGPLADADTWMPDFTDLLSRGLRAGVPKLQAAMGELAMPLTVMASQQGSSASTTASAASLSASSSSQPLVIQVLMPDGSAYAEYLVDPVMHKVMRTTNRKAGRRGL